MFISLKCVVFFLGALVVCQVVCSIDLAILKPHEIAILQFDSRPLDNYWESAAKWNSYYCALHGHLFLYYQLDGECHYSSQTLASPWCKVRAMIQANEQFPDVKLFMYLDSDAVVDIAYRETSLGTFATMMQKELDWKVNEKPLLFNQDGPCWWCNLIERVGYSICLNAGTVMWYRHPLSEQLLHSWWHAAMHPYSDNPLKRKFRTDWPWEQDRQMWLFNHSSTHIQIASQPSQPTLTRSAKWCLSHLPGWGCFVSHYCANKQSKQAMKELYTDLLLSASSEETPLRVVPLVFD